MIGQTGTGRAGLWRLPAFLFILTAVFAACPAAAADTTADKIARLEEALEAQQRAIAEQQKLIATLQKEIKTLRESTTALAEADAAQERKTARAAARRRVARARSLDQARTAAGFAASGLTAAPALASAREPAPAETPVLAADAARDALEPTGASREVVGEKPPEQERAIPDLPAIADTGGVLTPKHTLTIEPSLTLSHSSRNRFLFRGIEILPSFLIGVIEVNEADRDYVSAALGGRYGITDRLEASVSVPYAYRHDSVNQTSVSSGGSTGRRDVEGYGLGDIDFGLQYQLTQGSESRPIITANLRAKAPTGKGPFDIEFGAGGRESEIATGSGFWSIQPSVTAIQTMDPLVFYASVSYLANLGKDVNKVIPTSAGDAKIGEVDPGDAIGVNFGGAFAITDNVSVSLGYEHYYVFKTEQSFQIFDTSIGAFGPSATTESRPAHVGSLVFGANFRTRSGGSFNLSLSAGLTDDAPDVQLTLRRPFSFDLSR